MITRRDHHINTLLSVGISVMTTFFILTVGLVLFFSYSHSIEQNAKNSAKEIVRQANNNLDYYISDILNVADYVRNLARSSTNLSKDALSLRISSLIESRKDLIRLAVFDLDGNALISSSPIRFPSDETITGQLWFNRAKSGEGNFFFTGPHNILLSSGKEERVITYSQLITYSNAENNTTQKAILLIDLNFTAVSELSQKVHLSHTGYVYFISNDGDIVYHPKEKLIAEGKFREDTQSVQEEVYGTYVSIFEGRERLTIIDTVNYCRWRIVGVAFIDELLTPLQSFITLLFILLTLSIIIAIILSRTIANTLTNPLRELERIMRRVQTGDFSTPAVVEGSKEVHSLSLSFNIMIAKIRVLMEDIKNAEKLKRKQELEALQAKINPHFLYNTLDSVVWMAEQGDTEGVVKMITSLARLFRISISKGHEIITLKEELTHVECYLEILQFRYRDKFDFTIDLPEDLQYCPTIKLLFQPIVENAIYHGIKYLQEEGHISIKVSLEGDQTIIIAVKDNGVGMDEETLANLLRPGKPHRPHLSDGNGIGMINVDSRIKLYYGEGYGLTAESELDEGTTIYVRIRKDPDIQPVVIK